MRPHISKIFSLLKRNVQPALVEKRYFKYRRMKAAVLFNIYILNFNFIVLWGFLIQR